MYKRLFVLFGVVLLALLGAAARAPQADAGAPADTTGQFTVRYYNFIDGGGTECHRDNSVYESTASQIWNFYPENTSPVPGIVNTQNFMICWRGPVYFPTAGTWNVFTCNDDGMNVWLNGKIWMNAWWDQGPTAHSGALNIPAPGYYDLQVKYYNRTNAGTAVVAWVPAGQPNPVPCPYAPPPPPVCPGCPPCQGCPPIVYPTPTPVAPPCQWWPNCNIPPPPVPPCQWWPNCYNPPPPPPPPPVTTCWYRIRYGDTLYSIAWRFGVTTWQLQQWNNIPNPNVIYAGMVIRVCAY